MEGDVGGVRVIPPILEFIDIEKNELYETTVKVINVDSHNKRIKLQGPLSEVYKMYLFFLLHSFISFHFYFSHKIT